MKNVFWRIGFVLALLLVSTGFAVAAGGQDAAASEETLEITWFAWRGIAGEDAPIPPLIEDAISKKVGFAVKFNMVGGVADGEVHATQQMMLAANELPDVFNRFNIDPEFLAHAATKFSLNDLKANMPETYKFLNGLMEQLGLDRDENWGTYQDTDGMMWGVPRIWDMAWVPWGQMWRKDILDELGYDIPRTIPETEEVFEALKAVYPDMYGMGARGRTDWQAFDLVFNAYGIGMGRQTVRNGKIVQPWATREFREGLQVLRRWYEKDFIDPDFQNHAIEYYENMAAGKYIVVQWIGRGNWDFNAGEDTQYFNALRDNVPGASLVAATHIARDKNTKPAQVVWNPFLTQLTVLGKHLENDLERLHKIMQVGDVLALDREVKILSGSGIEGEHFFYPEGERVPKALPEVASMSTAERADKLGIGFIWQGNFSTYSMMNSRAQKVIDDYLLDPNGPYHSSKLDLLFPLVKGRVTDSSGEQVQASPPTRWFELAVKIITGEEPIEYYDEWLETYYDSGGRAWEEHATRLYLK